MAFFVSGLDRFVGVCSMTYHVYVLECLDKSGRCTLHVGIAKNVERRLADHKSGKVKATRGRSVKCLGYSELMSHGDALRLEIELKKQTPQQKRAWAGIQRYSCMVKHIWGHS